ncbi:uncharacterized protein RSE6_09553 [Rhynchosporium secalis]|uniref:Zn(2)-C6 fungal-type domain-containing protein n=1 Tax=Rhynchosporium secalis TaxID=38038 RepID=A0A1E1MI59_RHYSE|nr:uncharacterized protein RSE6_09553 [Rhynchosporium secalis]
MVDEVRRRAACDQCHSQKIKCPRQDVSKICDRCMKARTPCVFKPFRQKKTPEEDVEGGTDTTVLLHNSRIPCRRKLTGLGQDVKRESGLPARRVNPLMYLQHPYNDFDNYNFGISREYSIDFSNVAIEEPDIFAFANEVPYRKNACLDRPPRGQSNLLHELEFGRPSAGVTHSGDMQAQSTWSDAQMLKTREPEPIPKIVCQFSQLNVDLSDHKSSLPPLSGHDEVSPDTEMETEIPPTNECILEDTFRLTQNLIQIYPTLLNLFINARPPSQVTTPDSDFLSTDNSGSDESSSSSDVPSPSMSSKPKPA